MFKPGNALEQFHWTNADLAYPNRICKSFFETHSMRYFVRILLTSTFDTYMHQYVAAAPVFQSATALMRFCILSDMVQMLNLRFFTTFGDVLKILTWLLFQLSTRTAVLRTWTTWGIT